MVYRLSRISYFNSSTKRSQICDSAMIIEKAQEQVHARKKFREERG